MTDTTKKPKRITHRTPSGTFVYPRLHVADTKYKENGEYSVKLKLSAADAAPLKKLIIEATEKDYKAECAKQEKVKIKKSANLPFKDEENDQGETTGNTLFTFKLAGAFKDRATGEIVKLKVNLFNKDGSPCTEEVWGGTIGKIAFELKPYYTDGLGHGMTLRLKACRIEKLVTRGQGGAEQYGFEVEAPNETTEVGQDGDDEPTSGGKSDAKAAGDF